MRAWWFEFGSRVEAAALLYCPERIQRAMEAPSWRINQDVDHLGSAFRLRDGCLAFIAPTRCALTEAMKRASRDVRVFSWQGDTLAVRIDSFGDKPAPHSGDEAASVYGERLARGVMAIVARRVALPLPERGTIPLQNASTTVRRLGALIGVMAA